MNQEQISNITQNRLETTGTKENDADESREGGSKEQQHNRHAQEEQDNGSHAKRKASKQEGAGQHQKI